MFFFYLDGVEEKTIKQKMIGIFYLFHSICFEKYLEREELEKTIENKKMGQGIFKSFLLFFLKIKSYTRK